MNKLILLAMLLFGTIASQAQKNKLYNPDANALKDIAAAVKQAKAQKKYVLIQAGGNWCKWCIEFNRVSKEDKAIDSVINAGFVVYHLNWDKDHQNHAAFSKLNYPQRFGFPSFIILNEKGERIHTQNSEYLEDGKNSYNHQKVQSFLEMWSPRALNPKMYGDK